MFNYFSKRQKTPSKSPADVSESSEARADIETDCTENAASGETAVTKPAATKPEPPKDDFYDGNTAASLSTVTVIHY